MVVVKEAPLSVSRSELPLHGGPAEGAHPAPASAADGGGHAAAGVWGRGPARTPLPVAQERGASPRRHQEEALGEERDIMTPF